MARHPEPGNDRPLATLHRLALADDAANGNDPGPRLLRCLGQCFEGKRSLFYADELLEGWPKGLWPRAARSRLRVLICDQAFEAGFEVRNLLEAGRLAPALADWLATDEITDLAWLRLLWSMRATRPWDVCGRALTVFELAASDQDSGKVLSKYPDLLLVEQKPAPLAISLCGRGVLFHDTLFTTVPRQVEIVRKKPAGTFELVIDEHRFMLPGDPEALAGRLERWIRFYLHELLPKLADVSDWRSPGITAALQAHERIRCPECGTNMLLRIGDVGVLLEEGGESKEPASPVA